MEVINRKNHWETIYQTKDATDVSWFQPIPETSLDFFNQYQVPTSAKIIDIGGGDSLLVDHLLDLGYKEVTVLDISEAAVKKAQNRLGNKATDVTWIVCDITAFKPSENYDVWHDRAAFHFLTNEQEIASYLDIAASCIPQKGRLILGTFSENGPKKCSGITIKPYSEISMTSCFSGYFEIIDCKTVDHLTPFGTYQNFIFCSFRKI